MRSRSRPGAARPRMLGGLTDNERWLTRHARAGDPLHRTAGRLSVPALALLQPLGCTVASREMHFVGLENFLRVVESSTFWLALKNTSSITLVSQFFIVVLANILARRCSRSSAASGSCDS